MGHVDTIGFDRARLERLRSASIEAANAIDSIGTWDPAAADIAVTLQLTRAFLRTQWIPTIDEVLLVDAFDRAVRIGWLGRIVAIARPMVPVSWTGHSCPLPDHTTIVEPTGFEHLSDDELIEQMLHRLRAERAAHQLDHPFWTGSGTDYVEELRRRLVADPDLVEDLVAAPAGLAMFARVLGPDAGLTPDTRHRLAVGVLTAAFPDSIVDTELAHDAAARAARTIAADPDHIELLMHDTDAMNAIIARGHVEPRELGNWLGIVVDRLDQHGWPDRRTIDLVQSLGRFAHTEPLGTSTPPPELAVPLGLLTAAAMPLLAAGRTQHGTFLYPTIDGIRREHERVDREHLRELIGTALRDEHAAIVVLVGLRSTLRDAVNSDAPQLGVERVDEIARIVDEASVHEHAEVAAIEAAQIEWVSSMLGGLDKAVGRSGGPTTAAASHGIDQLQGLGAWLVDEDDLPFESIQGYYETARTFEIRRGDVLAAQAAGSTDVRLTVAVAALDVIDGRVDTNIDGTSHEANIAWLEFEDVSEPFVDLYRFPEVRW